MYAKVSADAEVNVGERMVKTRLERVETRNMVTFSST